MDISRRTDDKKHKNVAKYFFMFCGFMLQNRKWLDNRAVVVALNCLRVTRIIKITLPAHRECYLCEMADM